MIERDYIMRMIDLLAKVLARVLFLRKKLEFPQAADELAAAARNLLGLDPQLIRLMSDAQLINLLSSDESLGPSKCYVLGMLLKEEAELSHSQGNEEATITQLTKSLSLLLAAFLPSGDPVVPSHRDSIDEVNVLLSGASLPPHINTRLFDYYRLTGRYDKAEDTLFVLVDQDPEYLRSGLVFYEQLLTKSDDDLLRGNLPRSEIEEAIHELKQRLSRVS